MVTFPAGLEEFFDVESGQNCNWVSSIIRTATKLEEPAILSSASCVLERCEGHETTELQGELTGRNRPEIGEMGEEFTYFPL